MICEVSTPRSRKERSRKLPVSSTPTLPTKPTSLPRRAKLQAKIADELPNANRISLASRTSPYAGREVSPVNTRSAFNSPTTTTSMCFAPGSPPSSDLWRLGRQVDHLLNPRRLPNRQGTVIGEQLQRRNHQEHAAVVGKTRLQFQDKVGIGCDFGACPLTRYRNLRAQRLEFGQQFQLILRAAVGQQYNNQGRGSGGIPGPVQEFERGICDSRGAHHLPCFEREFGRDSEVRSLAQKYIVLKSSGSGKIRDLFAVATQQAGSIIRQLEQFASQFFISSVLRQQHLKQQDHRGQSPCCKAAHFGCIRQYQRLFASCNQRGVGIASYPHRMPTERSRVAGCLACLDRLA